jgi:hypothetical protein
MTLNDKLYDAIEYSLYTNSGGTIYGSINASEKCEAILEDIAIKFAEWLILNHTNCSFSGNPQIDKDTKILFSLFKLENNL